MYTTGIGEDSWSFWAVSMPSILPFKRMSISARSGGAFAISSSALSPVDGATGDRVSELLQHLLNVLGDNAFVLDDENRGLEHGRRLSLYC